MPGRDWTPEHVCLSEAAVGKPGRYFTSAYGTIHPCQIHDPANPCPWAKAWVQAHPYARSRFLRFPTVEAGLAAGHYKCSRCFPPDPEDGVAMEAQTQTECGTCGDRVEPKDFRAHLESHSTAFAGADPAWSVVQSFFTTSQEP